MEWWGYLLSGLTIWLLGFIAGRAAGEAQALKQMMAVSLGKIPQMPGLPPGMEMPRSG